jgi:tRNA pseudouridine55 synthase
MARFNGDIEQVPPMYSAIKQGGKPLYKLAREGVEVDRAARCVRIHRFDLRDFRGGEIAEIDVHVACSKGTYIRSLAVELGEALGVPAHVGRLRRTAVGPFALEHSVTLELLESLRESGDVAAMDALLKPMDEALGHFPLLRLSESSGFYLRQGQPVLVRNAPRDGMVRVALETGEFLGLGEILDDGRVAPRRLVVSGR